ncbi:hypothetical protein NEIMUCOT_03934 [Neisseria mucosa ATCC 25996]|uniref:Uncharacterized protein n=1 Tax=Neisseria mucosa (strain ATCC 25996 / DSM 4631 / NCTC 10774 / M26) TaxID=546266 RepID=D2ZTJ8_NEIM2|nr:hypothetical protein NEIMUCOT_03934 [Neisseria mucosa ATCC 25996]
MCWAVCKIRSSNKKATVYPLLFYQGRLKVARVDGFLNLTV